MNKIQTLCDIEGFSGEMEFLEEYANDEVVPGICMNKGCDYTAHYEPDQDHGYCEGCNTSTVVSGLVLLGLI